MTLIFRALLLLAAMMAAVIWWAAEQSHVIAMSLPAGTPASPLPMVAGGGQPGGAQYAGDGWRCSPLVAVVDGGLWGHST